MTFAIGTLGLTSALATLPLSGAWWVDVHVSPRQGTTGVALTGAQVVSLNGIDLYGTVLRCDVVDGMIEARIVAGAGGLSTTLAERYYKGGSSVRKIVGDILRDCGETLADDASAAILDQTMPTWQRAREPAGTALSRVVEAVGGSWRMTTTGQVLIVGTESWPTVAPVHTLIPGSDGALGIYRVAWPETTPDDLLPGVTFRGMRIRYVVHELTAASLRTEVRTQEPRGYLERMRALLSRGEWYSRLWSAVVDKQNADGTVDVVVDSKWGETQVPIRHGLPGMTVEIQQGQQILVGYENDDPKRPFAALWKSSGTAKIGTLVIGQNAVSLVMLPPQWFSAGAVGDAAAAAALLAITGEGNTGFLVDLTVPIVGVT